MYFSKCPVACFFYFVFYFSHSCCLNFIYFYFEVVVAFFREELKMRRKPATLLATVLITILGIICSLSMGVLSEEKIFGFNFFDLMDWISANMFLPLGGLFIALFIGWYFGRKESSERNFQWWKFIWFYAQVIYDFC